MTQAKTLEETREERLEEALITARRHAGATVIEPRSAAWWPDWNELWQFRHLFRALVWRNFKIRYRSTALGVFWVVLQPLLMMLVFTLVFGIWAGVASGRVPYSLHVLSGLCLLFFINRVMGDSIDIIRQNQDLTRKVYFPKLILPAASVTSTMVDLAVTFLLLMTIMLMQGIYPAPASILAPFYLLLLIALGLSLSVCLAALGIRYRDLNLFLPIVVLMLTYLSPIIYPMTLVPEQYLYLYALNPMVGIVNGFRWALLGAEPFYPWMGVISLIEVIILGLLGLVYFVRTERDFNDFL